VVLGDGDVGFIEAGSWGWRLHGLVSTGWLYLNRDLLFHAEDRVFFIGSL